MKAITNRLITTAELMDYLLVGRATIYRLRDKGLPYKKVGKSVRYDLAEVMQFIEGH